MKLLVKSNVYIRVLKKVIDAVRLNIVRSAYIFWLADRMSTGKKS